MADTFLDGLKVSDLAAEEFKFQINNYDGDFVFTFLLDYHSIYSDVITKKQRRLRLRDKMKKL